MRETLVVQTALTSLDLLLWRKYPFAAAGFVEQTLALNPALAALGAILPFGTRVIVETPAPPPATTPVPVVQLYD